jgi:hypothetical protein
MAMNAKVCFLCDVFSVLPADDAGQDREQAAVFHARQDGVYHVTNPTFGFRTGSTL